MRVYMDKDYIIKLLVLIRYALLVALLIFANFSCHKPHSELIIDWANPKSIKLHRFLTEVYKQQQFNGAVLVAENGKILYKNFLGIADFNTGQKLKNNSVFRLASVSKQFTAFAVLILVDRNQLSLSSELKDFFPLLAYDNITIHNLLTHTSGLPDYMNLLDNQWNSDILPENSDVIKLLASYGPKPHFMPGVKWEYSNTGYLLLASIIEKVSNMEFDLFLSQNIFGPVKMRDSFVLDYENKNKYLNRVIGYNLSANVENDHHYLNKIKGDGGIYSTLSDLYKWDSFLYKNTIISDSIIEKAFFPYYLTDDSVSYYGYGWSIGENRGVQFHSGSWLGFNSYFYRNTSNQSTIVLFDNISNPQFEYLQKNIQSILKEKEIL